MDGVVNFKSENCTGITTVRIVRTAFVATSGERKLLKDSETICLLVRYVIGGMNFAYPPKGELSTRLVEILSVPLLKSA